MPKYAMDFQSLTTVRHIDNNGHLIVDRTCITKAAINPYRGQEIPNWQALGLDSNKVYMLLRCPTELQRALPTFQGLQLLERHTPVSSEEPEKDSSSILHTQFREDRPTMNNIIQGSILHTQFREDRLLMKN